MKFQSSLYVNVSRYARFTQETIFAYCPCWLDTDVGPDPVNPASCRVCWHSSKNDDIRYPSIENGYERASLGDIYSLPNLSFFRSYNVSRALFKTSTTAAGTSTSCPRFIV